MNQNLRFFSKKIPNFKNICACARKCNIYLITNGKKFSNDEMLLINLHIFTHSKYLMHYKSIFYAKPLAALWFKKRGENSVCGRNSWRKRVLKREIFINTICVMYLQIIFLFNLKQRLNKGEFKFKDA